MPKVMRSRLSCRNSLSTMPHQRVTEKHHGFGPKLSTDCSVRWMNTSSRPVAAGCDAVAGAGDGLAQRGFQRGGSRPVTCSAEPKAATCSTPGSAAQTLGDRRQVAAGHLPGRELLAGNDLFGRALRHQPAVGDVGQLVAALGLVHVMRADQHRDAARRERVQLLPEVAARAGVDAGGRLVEQQQLGLVQHAGREREALLPAAGQRAGELRRAAAEAQAFDRPVDRRRGAPACRTCARRSRGSRGSTGLPRTRSAASCSRRAA